jgi:2-dehydropantoate 2-reductase
LLRRIVETFQAAGIEVFLSDDLERLVWGKLTINVGINALAAILRVPNGVLGITPECEKIMDGAVSEAVAVAEALGISLPYEQPHQQVKSVCLRTAENRASMLQDILRKKRTEIAAINGAVVRKGRTAGISTPYNLILSQLIEALEATSAQRIEGE